MSFDATTAALEWTLRVVLCAALVIHSILDITDPLTGAKSYFLNVEDSIPCWLLPAVGILRAVAAAAILSNNPNVVLGALAYVSALWCGAVYFHVRRKHHPAAVGPAIMFVLLALVVTALRVNFWFALAGTAVCAVAGVGLGQILVTPAKDGLGIHEQPASSTSIVRFPSRTISGTSSALLDPLLGRTEGGVIEHVVHDELPAEISAEEASAVVAVQEAGFIERNLGVGFEPVQNEKLSLLKFNRTSIDMVKALTEGASLDACRAALQAESFACRLSSGAFIFVKPWQYQAAVLAAEGELINHGGLKSSHIIVAESLEYLVEESLCSIGCGVWAKDRQQLAVPLAKDSNPSHEPITSDEASKACSSDESAISVIRNAFLCWVPRSQTLAHSGAYTI